MFTVRIPIDVENQVGLEELTMNALDSYLTVDPATLVRPGTLLALPDFPFVPGKAGIFVMAYPPHDTGELQNLVGVVGFCDTLDTAKALAETFARVNSGFIAVLNTDGEPPFFALKHIPDNFN